MRLRKRLRARVVRARLKQALDSRVEVYETDGVLGCGCRVKLDNLHCAFSYDRKSGVIELDWRRSWLHRQTLYARFPLAREHSSKILKRRSQARSGGSQMCSAI